jgi:hypothetical protein
MHKCLQTTHKLKQDKLAIYVNIASPQSVTEGLLSAAALPLHYREVKSLALWCLRITSYESGIFNILTIDNPSSGIGKVTAARCINGILQSASLPSHLSALKSG